MKIIQGIAASNGIAIGKVTLLKKDNEDICKRNINNVKREISRLETAKAAAVKRLNEIYLKSLKLLGEEDSNIFQIYIMMIQDQDYLGEIKQMIYTEQINAEYAVWNVGKRFAERFARMDSEYMQARSVDVIDISKRLIKGFEKKKEDGLVPQLQGQHILAADDLTPGELVQIEKENVLAIITQKGSRTSHLAIFSRTMGIPAVVGLAEGFKEVSNGEVVVVDGFKGEVIVQAGDRVLKKYREKQKKLAEHNRNLQKLVDAKAVTKDGIEIQINANIGQLKDVENVLKNGADGIGLFRSEFLYMGRTSPPTEEEQFQAYRQVLEKMKGKYVIIRTLDIGADKQVSYLNLSKEANPALGYRAIRICLDREDLFYTQLRALLRASVFGKLAIMFPMIISIEEIKTAKNIIKQVKADLRAKSISFAQDVKIGIMIETPASVMLSRKLAKEVDFFSIGTNDLTQYTLAVDRMNGKIGRLYDQCHPAVLEMIKMTVKNAKKTGIPVGICGESAADPNLTEFYLRIGIKELSVAASAILELKETVREINLGVHQD